MTPNELRALADALDRIARTHVMIAHDEWETQHRAADYLRAQADAHPAPHYAMLDSHRRLVEQSIWDAEHPSGMSTHDGKARIDASVLRRMLAIIDSLPAAPQEGNVWKQIIPDNVPQAEPKREPVGTLTIRDDMGAEITFHRSFTMRPRQTFAIYPNWDLLTHDIPTRGAFVVNAPKEIGNE